MDFHGMKRKDLQNLCKKHGIPANLKNIEMATRLASVLQKEDEETVEVDCIKEELVACKKAKKVKFSPESDNQVFEFTRSLKKLQRRNVRTAKDLHQGGGVEVRRSKRVVSKEITVAGSSGNESNSVVEDDKGCCLLDATKMHKVTRRSKRIGSSGSAQEEGKDTDLIALEEFEDRDVRDGLEFENVGRRSTRLAAKTVKSCVEGGTSKAGGLLLAKESKEEKRTMQSKRSVGVDCQEDELVKRKTKEPLTGCEVLTRVEVQDVSEVEMVTRRSKRLCNKVNVPLVDGNVKAVKRDDLEVEKSPKQSKKLGKSVSELIDDGQVQMGDKQPKTTSRNDREDVKLLRRSKRTALDNMLGQVMSNPPSRCSVIDSERDEASSVDNVKKLNVNDEMQVRVRFTRNYSKNDSIKAARVVEGNLVDKKTDETLVKSSKRVTRKMKRDRSAESGLDRGTASTHSNLTAGKPLDESAQFEQKEACRADVEARDFFKKSKTKNQECIKDKPQGIVIIEDSPSSSEAKAAESVTIVEKVLDPTMAKSIDSSQRSNTRELNCELMEGECEEKLEQDTVLMPVMEEDKEEVCLSPDSVPLAVNSPKNKLRVPTGHILLKDFASTAIVEENTKAKDETVIFTPASEIKDHSSVAKLAIVEAILGDSADCCKEDGKGSLEKDVQAENLHVNISECNTENRSAEEMEISKVGCMSVGLCVNLTPERLSDAYTQLVPEEAAGPNVETRSSSKKMKTVSSEIAKGNPQGMAEDLLPSTCGTKTTEPIMISENVLDSTSKVSVRNTHELSSELMEEEREEKQEQDTVMMTAAKKDKEEASSLSEFLIDRPEVSIPESDLFVETTPPSPSVQSANRHGKLSEYNIENSSVEEQADICKVVHISDGHCVNRETFDEVNDDSLTKSERTISSQRDCKPNALELSGSLSTDFASLLPNEENVSECLEEDEMKALSQPIPINKAASDALDRSPVLTTPERNLISMEQLSESRAADLVSQHNDEAVESHAVVFTTPEKVLLLGDSGLDEVGKEEEHTATDSPDESDVLNTSQNEAINEEESIVVGFHDESNIAGSQLRHSSEGDFKEDGIDKNEENRTVELHCESGICTIPNRHAILGDFVSDGAENSGGNKAMEHFEESAVFSGLEERHGLFGYSEQDKAIEGEVNKSAQLYEEAGLSTVMHKANWLGTSNADESGSLERKLLHGDSERKKAVETAENEAAEFHDESTVPNIPERRPFLEEFELEEAEKSEENKAVELQVDCDLVSGAEKQYLHETDEGKKGDNRIAKSHDMSVVLTASENHSLMRDFEPDEAENKYSENKDVELLSESNISINLWRHSLSGDCGLDGTKKIEDTAVTCEESFVFSSPERRHHLENSEPNAGKEVEFKDESAFFTRFESRLLLGESGQDRLGDRKSGSSQYQSHHASSPKVTLKDDSVVWGSHVSTLDLGENIIAASSGSIAPKVSYSHEFSAGETTVGAEFMPKSFEAENVAGLDATQATSKQSRGNSPHVDSVNVFDFEGANTIMNAERNASFSCYALALPAKGNSETIGEITSPFEVAETCPLVSEESSPSTNIQKQINDSLEELAITGGSSVSGKTCILGGTEDEHLGCNSEEDFRNKCEKCGGKILEDEATGPIATPFGKDISLTPDEFTVQDNINEEGIDATQGTSTQNRGHSPHVSSVNLFDSDIDETETTMEAERNVPFNSHVLALPAEGDFETSGEISSHLEVGGTCCMASEESAPSADIKNQTNDALKELAVTDNKEADELIAAKVTKNVNSSGGFSVSGKTCVLGGTEDEHLGYSSDFKSTYEKSGHKFLKDEATDPVATAFEKDISVTPDEFTLQKNRNEEAADDEMVKGEANPSPEETLNESYEKRKEYVKIGESGTLSAKQVRREPILIYRTQAKPKKHDMKENALNSKIVDNLNVTAPRTSKRQPLQDLRNN